MIVNNNEFHKVQLNSSEDIVEGRVIKSSVMINIRCDNPDELIRLYREVKAKLNDGPKKSNGKELKENGNNGEKVPICGCGLPMALRQNKKQNSWFWSCQRWSPKGDGCGMTLPYSLEKELIEDVISVDSIPF